MFEDGPVGGQAYAYHYACGIWLDNLIYKSFFISFDISQFTNDDNINMLISDAINWFGVSVDIDEPEIEVSNNVFSLSQNYPNPFSAKEGNSQTTISYNIPGNGNVTIEVYNIRGQKIKTLVSEYKTAGTYQVSWNGKNNNGKLVNNGIYLYKIKSEEFTATKKMAFIK
jgi:flagellar hook assembly protein FlgD